jgi:hypothetical protein
MVRTTPPRGKIPTEAMGFQTGDLRGICSDLVKMPLVTGVYLAGRPGRDDEGTIYVTVKGWGEASHEARLNVTRKLAEYRAGHRKDMEYSAFVFNYHVMVEDESMAEPYIPERAERFHAA